MNTDTTHSAEPLVLPYRAYDVERRAFVTLGRTFDAVHAVAQVWGVLECACEIVGQLRRAVPVDLGGGRQRVQTSSPVRTDCDPRFGPAYDDGKVSAFVPTVAVEALQRMFDAASARKGCEPASLGWVSDQASIGRVWVEAPDVRRGVVAATDPLHAGEACIATWHELALARYHGEEAWPFPDFLRWYLGQPQPAG